MADNSRATKGGQLTRHQHRAKSRLDPKGVRAASLTAPHALQKKGQAQFEAASPVEPPGATWVAREGSMAESVYKVVELVGTSTEFWEKAAAAAVERASKS